MIKKIRNAVHNQDLPRIYYKLATQVGNYCYLIAGTEMLLSCPVFAKFLFFYTARNSEVFPEHGADITKICQVMQFYLKSPTKDHEFMYYRTMEYIIFRDMNIDNAGGAEDVNIVFLYFQRSRLYLSLFSAFEYIINDQPREPIIKTDHAIYVFYQPGIVVNELSALAVRGVYAVIIDFNQHYEIFRATITANNNANNTIELRAINTNTAMPCVPRSIIVFCEKNVKLKIE